MMQSLTDAAMEYIRVLFAGNVDGHGSDHAARVYRNAMIIADTEPTADRLIVALSAILHDADDHKLFQTENNGNARRFLEEQGMDPDVTERIVAAINSVSFRMPTDWTPSAPSESPEPSPSAGNMSAPWNPRSGIFMRNCFC